jgi:hypothetical protein
MMKKTINLSNERNEILAIGKNADWRIYHRRLIGIAGFRENALQAATWSRAVSLCRN